MATKKTETPAKAEDRQKRCFFITPIGGEKSPARQHADWVFFHAIQPVFAEKGYESTRADLIRDPFMINDSVFEAITEADICVADLTLLNANVFYELGVRHTIEKPVIHIAQADTALPFDNAGYRTIMFDRHDYQSMEMLKNELAFHIDAIEKPDFKLSNPLTQFRGRERVSESADSNDQLIMGLQDELAAQRRAMTLLRNEVALLRPVPVQNGWLNAVESFNARPTSVVETLRAYGTENSGGITPTVAEALAKHASIHQSHEERLTSNIDRELAAAARRLTE